MGSTCPLTQPQAGNPVTVCSGNKYQEAVDYRGSGTHALSFVRSYNSLGSHAGALGIGWRHAYERYLVVDGNAARVVRADGQELEFRASGGVWFPRDRDVTLQLSVTGDQYLLTNTNDTVETYDSSGRLSMIQWRDGYTQSLAYDATTGTLGSVSDSLGRSLGFTYTPERLVRTLTDPAGQVYVFDYIRALPDDLLSPTKKLAAVRYPDATPADDSDNPVVTYLYENALFPAQLTGIVDERGQRYATWDYDADGRPILSEHAQQADRVAIAYDNETIRTVTSVLGQPVRYTFLRVQNSLKLQLEERLATDSVPAASRSYTYDANGFLASMRDWKGTLTTYVHDARGLQTSRTEAEGTPLSRTITTTWHATLRLPVRIVAPGKTTDYTYDARGNLLALTETDTTSRTEPYSTNGQTRTWRYTYDDLGNVLTEDGPRTDIADVTTYAYAPDSGDLVSVTNALGHETRITAYDARGLPLAVRDANGIVTTLAYDARGRLTTSTVDGTATTTVDYDPAGLVSRVTLPDGAALEYGYDVAQRLIRVTNRAGEPIDYVLDGQGNITQATVSTGGGVLVRQQRFVYDTLGRTLQAIGALPSQVTAYAYDGESNRIAVTDARDFQTTQAFDALNRVVRVTDPVQAEATTVYDEQDNVVGQSDYRGLVTTYIRDGFGRVIQQISPETGTTTYVLDAAGNRLRETDARGITVERAFDAIDRVTSETFPASLVDNATYAYDATADGNRGVGRLTGRGDASGTATWVYDSRGNVLRETRTLDGINYTTRYAYTLADRLQSITYPSGRMVTYARDADGRVTTVTTTAGAAPPLQLASVITWQPFGPLAGLTYGNGLVHMRGYDGNGWPASITTVAGANRVQDLVFTHDASGNITGIADRLDPTRDQTFGYDGLSRLTQATGAYGERAYAYDAGGNRVARTATGVEQAYAYPATSNRLASVTEGGTARTFAYTPSGNVAADNRGSAADVAYTYDGRNRLQAVSEGGAERARYTYTAQGERVRATVDGSTTYLHYDQQGRRIAETDADGTLLREYIWLEDWPLAQIEADGSVYYVHTDHLGTPQQLTNATGAVVWDRQQEPFGEDYRTGFGVSRYFVYLPFVLGGQGQTQGAAVSPAPVGMTLRFPGQFANPESGLYYNYFRDYDASIGRYIQADPIGQMGGVNLYGYAEQNPVNWSDPTGEYAIALQAGASLLAGAAVLIGVANNVPQPAIWNPNDAVETGDFPNCPNGHQDPDSEECLQLRQDVQRAKSVVRGLGKCEPGMEGWELRYRHAAWVDLAVAREKRDIKCYGGGDKDHIDERRKAWDNVGRCERLMGRPTWSVKSQ